MLADSWLLFGFWFRRWKQSRWNEFEWWKRSRWNEFRRGGAGSVKRLAERRN